jgi:hypothetical protein
MSWMVRRRSWWMSSWICSTVSRVVQLVGLPVYLSSSTDVQLVWNCACHWNTCVWLKILWSIMKIATGHAHDSKQTRVKTAHIHPASCNLAHWLTRHGSPTIYQCFVLPQLVYIWWHQSRIFLIPPRIWLSGTTFNHIHWKTDHISTTHRTWYLE